MRPVLLCCRKFLFPGKIRKINTMATTVLERLQKQANQADELILELHTQISSLRAAEAAKHCRAEEEKLKKENEEVRIHIAEWKQKLIQAEIRNGVKQIPLPAKSSTGPVKVTPVAAPAAPVSDNKAAAQQEKKEKKPKGEGKTKQQPPASSEPVDVSRVNMRIGQIVNVKKHPEADTLYVEEVNLGEERNRTIVSGLVTHVTLEEMQNRIAVFIVNLKPAKMRGIMSEGMIMCASSPEQVEIINPPAGAEIGDPVTVEGYPGTPDVMMPPKKKIFEQVQPDLRINGEGLATYKGSLWRIAGKEGTFKAATMTNSGIK